MMCSADVFELKLRPALREIEARGAVLYWQNQVLKILLSKNREMTRFLDKSFADKAAIDGIMYGRNSSR